MRRFLAFPLILGIMGALFPVLTVEGLLSVVPVILRSGGTPFSPPPDIVRSVQQVALAMGAIGAFLGLGAALFDAVLNRRKRRKAGQLIGNVAWCALYAQIMIAVNALIVFSSVWCLADKLSQSQLKTSILSFFPWVPLLLHLVATGWGTIRTITTDNVLDPRTLRAKLKRSTDVES